MSLSTDNLILFNDELKILEKMAEELNNIPPGILMEEASSVIFEQLKKDFDLSCHKICIIAGFGNNGGDALSLARKLLFSGYAPDVYVFSGNSGTKLYDQQKSILATINIRFHDIKEFSENSNRYTLIIDGIFGIGYKHKNNVDNDILFRLINESKAVVVSIDVPSGLSTGYYSVNADMTYSIGFLKNYFFNLKTRKSAGVIRDLKISFDVKNLGRHAETYYSNNIEHINYKTSDFVHKYSRGGCLLIGGSPGKFGSIIFSSESALRSGCGISIVLTKKNYIRDLNVLSKNIVIDGLVNYEKYIGKINSVVIGPGLESHEKSGFDLLIKIMTEKKQFVLDASFFSIFGTAILNDFEIPPVLTPHSGEFKLFFKEEARNLEIETIETVKKLSIKYKCIIILKDSFLTIGFPSGKIIVYDNPSRILSQAGSGDILSGIIGSLLSQGIAAEDAILESIRIFYDAAKRISIDGYKTYSPDTFIDLIGKVISG